MSATRYNVGDRVKVREDLVVGKYYGEQYFNNTMSKLRGQIVNIRYKHPFSYELVNENYFWTDEMFEGIVREKIVSATVINSSQTGCDKQDSDDRFMPTVVQTGFRFL